MTGIRRSRRKDGPPAFKRRFRLVSRLRDGLDVAEELKVRCGLLEALSQRGLRCVGAMESGWIIGHPDRAVTEADRDCLRAWLQARSEVAFAEVGPCVPEHLVDRDAVHAR